MGKSYKEFEKGYFICIIDKPIQTVDFNGGRCGQHVPCSDHCRTNIVLHYGH